MAVFALTPWYERRALSIEFERIQQLTTISQRDGSPPPDGTNAIDGENSTPVGNDGEAATTPARSPSPPENQGLGGKNGVRQSNDGEAAATPPKSPSLPENQSLGGKNGWHQSSDGTESVDRQVLPDFVLLEPPRNTFAAFICFLIGIWHWACITIPAIGGLVFVYFPAMFWCIFFRFMRDGTRVALGPVLGPVLALPFDGLHSLASMLLEHVLTPIFNGYWEMFDYRLADLYAQWLEVRESQNVIGFRRLGRDLGLGTGPLRLLDELRMWLEHQRGYFVRFPHERNLARWAVRNQVDPRQDGTNFREPRVNPQSGGENSQETSTSHEQASTRSQQTGSSSCNFSGN